MLEEEIHFAISGTRLIYVTHDGVHTMQGFSFFLHTKKKVIKKINVEVRERQNDHIYLTHYWCIIATLTQYGLLYVTMM